MPRSTGDLYVHGSVFHYLDIITINVPGLHRLNNCHLAHIDNIGAGDVVTTLLPEAIKGAHFGLLFGGNNSEAGCALRIECSGEDRMDGTVSGVALKDCARMVWDGTAYQSMTDAFYLGESVLFICVADGKWIMSACGHVLPTYD